MSTSTTIIMAIIISFAVSVILCPIVIPILKKMKFGQYIREVGTKISPEQNRNTYNGWNDYIGRSYCNIFDFYDSGKEY